MEIIYLFQKINPEIIFEHQESRSFEVISMVNKANQVDQRSQLYIVFHVSFSVYLSFSVLNLEVFAFHFDVGSKTCRPVPSEHERVLGHLPEQKRPCPFYPFSETKNQVIKTMTKSVITRVITAVKDILGLPLQKIFLHIEK